MIAALLVILGQTPDLSPNAGGLPGSAALASIVQGLAYIALLGCGAGLIIGAGMWGIGASNNPYQVANGKRTIVLSALGAALVGASTFLVRYFFNLGSGINPLECDLSSPAPPHQRSGGHAPPDNIPLPSFTAVLPASPPPLVVHHRARHHPGWV